jgi:hypothetical protein
MTQQSTVSCRYLMSTLALGVLGSLCAGAQSFDCDKAKSAVELAICGDKLDRYASKVMQSRTAVCQVIADRYRPHAHLHPGEPPLRVLEQVPNSGLHLVSASDPVEHPSTELVSWASKQQPPFKLSPDLLKSLELYEQLGGGGNLVKGAGVPFYSITRSEGSMGCSDSRSSGKAT